MDASIIITQYKQAELLRLILLSLAHQTTNSKFELIICDDGGTDEANQLVEQFASKNQNIDTYYLWQQDKGFRAGQARNMGIRQATGDILILLDGDMIPTLDYVEKHIHFHKHHRNTLVTGGRMVVDDSAIIGKNLDEPVKLFELLKAKSFVNQEELDLRTKWYKSDKPWMTVFSCNLSLPRNKFARYSELFVGWGIEDWDFSLRLYKAGYKIKLENSISAFHIDYKPVISNSFRNNKHAELVNFARNALLLIDQYPDDDLRTCAMALCNYRLNIDRWQWGGDGAKLHSQDRAIAILRDWLADKKVYSRQEKFFVEPNYLASIIIVCDGRTNNLERALTALQGHRSDKVEIIIVDDVSRPTQFEKHKKLLNRLSVSCKIIRRYDKKYLAGESSHSSVKQALGDTVIFLDEAAIPMKDFWRELLRLARTGTR